MILGEWAVSYEQGNPVGLYLRLKVFRITQLEAQGPSGTSVESNKVQERDCRATLHSRITEAGVDVYSPFVSFL